MTASRIPREYHSDRFVGWLLRGGLACGLAAFLAAALFAQGSAGDQSPAADASPSGKGGPAGTAAVKNREPAKPAEGLVFPIEQGSIDGQEFFAGVVGRMHWTTEVAAKVLQQTTAGDGVPEGRLPLAYLEALSVLAPHIFYVEPSRTGVGGGSFHVDLAAMEKEWTRQKVSLRQWLAEAEAKPLFELCGEVGFEQPEAVLRVVVVLAGLHADEQMAIDFAHALHAKTGIPACAFRYPNDAPIRESAEYLSLTLAKMARDFPRRKVYLVTHSMGGLVARAALERPEEASVPTHVERLIQLCPPNHGTLMAEYGPLLEGFEHLDRLFHRQRTQSLFATIADGFNEAPGDLKPRSAFLEELNAAPRHPQVRYAILAGDAGFVDPSLLTLGGQLLEAWLKPASSAGPVERRMREVMQSPELQRGSGDGVVALTSAKLEGVEDFEILPIDHLDWMFLESRDGQRVLHEVAERLIAP